MLEIKLCIALFMPLAVMNVLVATTTEDLLLKVIASLSTVLTVIIGIFLTAFIKHVSDHSPKNAVTESTCVARESLITNKLETIQELLKLHIIDSKANKGENIG